jgi:formylmethanofuran dehydrogenase subunit E
LCSVDRLPSEPFSTQSDCLPEFRFERPMIEKKKGITNEMVRSAVKFHGHLGPFLILGLRMGLVAVRTLCPRRLTDLSAFVWSSRSPPQSCVIDGIQFSSGCTLGKGNIRVRSSRTLQVAFRSHNGSIIIKPTGRINRMLSTLSKNETQARLRSRALHLSAIPDSDLLSVTRTH